MVTIKIVEARGIKAADFGGTSDPFVELRIRGDTQALKTKTIKKTLNPYWNEEFTLYPKDVEKDYIEMKLYDYDAGTSNDLIGGLEIPVAALVNKPPTDSWREWGKKKGPGNYVTGKHGEVHLIVEFRKAGQAAAEVPPVAGVGVQQGAAPPAAGMPQMPPQQGMPPQGMPPQGYPQQPGYPPQAAPGYPPQGAPGYPPQGYPPQGAPGYPPQGYPPQGAPGYPPQGAPGQYPPPGMGAPAAYPAGGIPPGYKMNKKGKLKPIKDKKDKKKKKKK
jgi:C2 domain/XYPPX repeat (two copies)